MRTYPLWCGYGVPGRIYAFICRLHIKPCFLPNDISSTPSVLPDSSSQRHYQILIERCNFFCGHRQRDRKNPKSRNNQDRQMKRCATTEVTVFGQNVFWVTGLLNPKSFEYKSCAAIFFGAYLSHGIVHRVTILFSSKISIWEGIEPIWGASEKNVVHLCRT